jgi:hypothetical protein
MTPSKRPGTLSFQFHEDLRRFRNKIVSEEIDGMGDSGDS